LLCVELVVTSHLGISSRALVVTSYRCACYSAQVSFSYTLMYFVANSHAYQLFKIDWYSGNVSIFYIEVCEQFHADVVMMLEGVFRCISLETGLIWTKLGKWMVG